MNQSYEYVSKELKKRNIRPSLHRIKVLEYLYANQCHPTVEHIFNALHKEIPTLSKTTVYNTLRVFAEASLVNVLAIDDHESRYDIITTKHGHFKCNVCGTIYNFSINIDDFSTDELDNFTIQEKNVNFKGVCSACVSK